SRLVNGRRLNSGDLVLPEGLAHDVEAAGERRVAEAALPLAWPAAPDGGGQCLFWVDEFGLGLGQGRGQRGHGLTVPVPPPPPSIGRRSSPPLTWNASLAPHARSPPWRPPASAP